MRCAKVVNLDYSVFKIEWVCLIWDTQEVLTFEER